MKMKHLPLEFVFSWIRLAHSIELGIADVL
jgi:hypothetical protein